MTDPALALRASLDETAEDLYEHAPCGYLSLLDDGVIAKVNATFLEWTGYERADLVGGRRFRDLLSVGGRIYYETHFQPLLRMQGGVREVAFEITRKDGDRLAVLVNARHRDQAPGVAITRITVFDATDRRRYERELLAARHRAEDIAQALQNLLATISHDVRAPLSAITTATALLEKSPLTREQAACIRVLRSSSAHAMELVTNALDLGRLDAGRTPLRERAFGVRDFVEELAATARAAAIGKPVLDITTRVDDAVPDSLVGDRAKIGQVITNLLMNAVKFTERGFVTLVVSQREATHDAVTVDVMVSDSGIGIAADRLPHIFDEYAQASDDIADRYGGSGLGLAIARRLLQLYGSTLHVASTVGQGTTFSFGLTLKRPEVASLTVP
jgi:PAS domain S-box-containing protein